MIPGDINKKVYEQGKLLLRYLKDITLDEEESIIIIDEDTI